MNKILSLAILLIMLVPLVSAVSFNDTQRYWNWDGGDLTDEILGLTLRNIGQADSNEGFVLEGFDFESSESDYLHNNTYQGSFTDSFTWNLWINQETQSTNQAVMDVLHPAGVGGVGNNVVEVIVPSDGSLQFFGFVAGVAICSMTSNAGEINPLSWSMMTITVDSTNCIGYVNGTQVVNTSVLNVVTFTNFNDFYVGSHRGVGSHVDGRLDELGIWDRALTPDEVFALYNDGVYAQYPFNPPPSIITNNTLVMTTATANGTQWQINKSFPIPTNISSPTVTFQVHPPSNCTIGTVDQNFTDMLAGDANRLCATLNNNSQTCTLPATDPLVTQIDQIYLSCLAQPGSELALSTSGALFVDFTSGNVTPPPTPPTNITGNFSCIILSDVCVNGKFSCYSQVMVLAMKFQERLSMKDAKV